MEPFFIGETGKRYWEEVYTAQEREDFEYFLNLKIGDFYEGCDGYNHRIIARMVYYRPVGEQTITNYSIKWDSISDEEMDIMLDLQEEQEEANHGKEEVINEISFLGEDGMHHCFPGGGCVDKYNPDSPTREAASIEEQKRVIAYFFGRKGFISKKFDET